MRQSQDTYKEVRVFEYPNAIVRVYIPDISDEENERRMERVRKAAADLLREALKNEKKKDA